MVNFINCLLAILAILIAFFVIIAIYLKFNYQKFSPIQIIPKTKKQVKFQDKIVHELDSRYRYPELPPANPMVDGTYVETFSPSSSDLYSRQTYTSRYALLNQPDINGANDLNNNVSIIKIPLQYNEPYEEPLRSQAILVNDYNKIKYGNCKNN